MCCVPGGWRPVAVSQGDGGRCGDHTRGPRGLGTLSNSSLQTFCCCSSCYVPGPRSCSRCYVPGPRAVSPGMGPLFMSTAPVHVHGPGALSRRSEAPLLGLGTLFRPSKQSPFRCAPGAVSPGDHHSQGHTTARDTPQPGTHHSQGHTTARDTARGHSGHSHRTQPSDTAEVSRRRGFAVLHTASLLCASRPELCACSVPPRPCCVLCPDRILLCAVSRPNLSRLDRVCRCVLCPRRCDGVLCPKWTAGHVEVGTSRVV